MEQSNSTTSFKSNMSKSNENSRKSVDDGEEQGALSYIKNLINNQQAKKDKNDRSRFLGEGVSYKAKLIGILEVSEARGDRMCQEALADLKMAIRAAGEHKQRININIAIDGLRLRDEKTGDCLYHHPVHKISFIAQDMTDSRAFGYIFGSPDTGHRFFGIKTDKAASQVVISMRDLFQVVFELKKKEIEMAKQHIEQHQMKFSSPFPIGSHLTASNTSSNASSSSTKAIEPIKILSLSEEQRKEDPSSDLSQKKVVDLLLDLELELSNIHQGINQMIKITPCDPMGSSTSMKLDRFEDSFNNVAPQVKLPPPPDSAKRTNKSESQWIDQDGETIFEDAEGPVSNTSNATESTKTRTLTSSTASTSSAGNNFVPEELLTKRSDSPKDSFDVFTDLDPLGTGRSRPYVDKKDFFQDLKNPPKKLLKDLVSELPCEKSIFQTNVPSSSENTSKQDIESDLYMSKPVCSRTFSDPFQEDPFEKDPFNNEFPQEVTFKSYAADDPFEKFADFTSFGSKENNLTISPPSNKRTLADEKHSPLKVSLPPEKNSGAESSPILARKYNRLQKHNTITGSISLSSPKLKNRKMVSQISVDAFNENFDPSHSFENVTPSDGSVPEPPPRGSISSCSGKPPPLPPKKLSSSTGNKPVPRPPNSDYDYIENYQSNAAYTGYFGGSGPAPANGGPPLPAPARKTKSGQKSSEPEYYLQPFPLLPPPKKKTSPKVSESSDNTQSNVSIAPCPTKSLDITLSQLTKTGFSDLAASLNMSPSSLSKMTLQDLTKCLENLSDDNQIKEKERVTEPAVNISSNTNKTVTENSDVYFSAEFEAHFGSNNSGPVTSTEESLFDKYAVFRELVEQEQKQALTTQSPTSVNNGKEIKISEALEEIRNPAKEADKIVPPEDRYAALRDLCLDEVVHENEMDGSDKDDSIVEALDEDTELFPSHLEEDTDLLPSHPHSESTESPTVTMKEHQSVMETTIMEEDVSALDEDDVPDEPVDLLPRENDASMCEKKHDASNKYESPSILPEVGMLESKVNSNQEPSSNNAWAKFETSIPTPNKSQDTPNDGHVSPWSADSKENDLSPTIQDKKKFSRSKKRIVKEENENDDHWNMRMEPRSWSPSWRENGWSDGDSLCDEVPPYVRDYHCDYRSCRRRVSPWNSRDQSPWDEDERELTEDQWEECRWQGDPRQGDPRQRGPRYKGPSWEDERRRYYEEVRKSRKQMAWSSDIDRKSSRESLTWEDDDRYSKRSYVERRHHKWDHEVPGRHRRWRDRERVEPSKKMNARYYRDRSHDHQWDDDYTEQSEAEQSHWPQRPRSCDRSRRQYAHHSSDDFNDRRYPRTMNRDEYSGDIDYRRRAQTLQLQKSRRKHNVTSSPFEDDFNAPHFGYSNEINYAGSSSDLFEGETKQSSMDSRKKYPFSECSQVKDYSQFGSPHTPGSVHSREDELSVKSSSRCCQQSPFEDDFTSPETRRCSGRSVSSDLSDPKSGDDVFYSETKEPYKMKCDNRRLKLSNKSDPGTSSAWTSSKPATPGSEYPPADNCRKKKINEREEPTDFSSQYNMDKKVNVADYKPILNNLKRSDSSSSLKKSESINIFARNRDPFDDDFFCESTSKPCSEKSKSKFSDPVKWNDAFNSFNFADEPK